MNEEHRNLVRLVDSQRDLVGDIHVVLVNHLTVTRKNSIVLAISEIVENLPEN